MARKKGLAHPRNKEGFNDSKDDKFDISWQLLINVSKLAHISSDSEQFSADAHESILITDLLMAWLFTKNIEKIMEWLFVLIRSNFQADAH